MTYPNIMVVRYLEAAGQLTPEFKLKALALIQTGYQRLLTFQARGGGFALYSGQAYSDRLTAYGLLQMHEMAQVIYVDPSVIERARTRLEANVGGVLKRDATGGAFMLWALLRTGTPPATLSAALDTLVGKLGQANAYTRALALRALVIARPDAEATRGLLKAVGAAAIPSENGVSWRNDGATMMYGYGRAGDLELTAILTGGLLKARSHPALTGSAVGWLIKARNPRGFWGSTFPTVQTLAVLLAAADPEFELTAPLPVRIAVNGVAAPTLTLTPDQRDVVQTVELTRFLRPGANQVTIQVPGKTPMTCSVVWRAYVPWGEEEERPGVLGLDLRYDRTTLRRGRILRGTATVSYRGQRTSSMVLLDLGIPPGFSVDRRSLERLRRAGKIDRYDIRPRQLSLYLDRLEPGSTTTLGFGLRAGLPVKGKPAASEVWEYYEPGNRARTVPQVVEVTD